MGWLSEGKPDPTELRSRQMEPRYDDAEIRGTFPISVSGALLRERHFREQLALEAARIVRQTGLRIEQHRLAPWQGVRLPAGQARIVGVAAARKGEQRPLKGGGQAPGFFAVAG